MIIVKLIVADKNLVNAVTESILQNKFSVHVFVNTFESYLLSPSQVMACTELYAIQFVSKSVLFTKLEASLKKEFPAVNFYICATPIVHISINLHNKIKRRVVGLVTKEEVLN